MSPPSDRPRMKGFGRVAFIAQLAEITAELDAGWPIKAIYDNRKQRLGVSYVQFTRYVDQFIRQNRRPQASTRGPAAVSQASPPTPPQAPTVLIASEGTNDAGYRPARTFNHDPLERPGDRKRLLGED
jgi:Family of unknown function (DUF5338)